MCFFFPPTLQQVPTTHQLFILLTNLVWLGSFDHPMSQNPLCHLPLALRLLTQMTLKQHTHLLLLPRDTHHTRLEIEWDLLRSIPIQGSLSMGPWALPMAFMLPFTTVGEYGGLR